MRVLLIAISAWAVLLVNTAQASVPTTIACQNDTGVVLYLGNPDGDLLWEGTICSALNMPYTQFLQWWQKQGINQLAVMVRGAHPLEGVPIFNRPLPFVATSTEFSVPQKGQEVIYKGRQFIFDIFQHGSTATFRIVALPPTHNGVKIL